MLISTAVIIFSLCFLMIFFFYFIYLFCLLSAAKLEEKSLCSHGLRNSKLCFAKTQLCGFYEPTCAIFAPFSRYSKHTSRTTTSVPPSLSPQLMTAVLQWVQGNGIGKLVCSKLMNLYKEQPIERCCGRRLSKSCLSSYQASSLSAKL